MTISKEQLENGVRTMANNEFEDAIRDRIKLWEEYSNKKFDYDDVFDRIVEKMINGYDSESFTMVDGNDEYEFELYDRWQQIEENVSDYSTEELKKFVEDGIDVIDYYSSEWITENIAEIFDEDYNNLYKNEHFDYCDSYSGALYLTTNGNDYGNMSDDLEQYSDDMETALDEIDNDVCMFDIDDLFNSVLLDLRYVNRYSVDSDDLRAVEKLAIDRIKDYLKGERRDDLDASLEELSKEMSVINSDTNAGRYLKTEIKQVEDEIKEITEFVTGGSK